jgi:hypothetical protein
LNENFTNNANISQINSVPIKSKGNGKVKSLCLTKYYAMKHSLLKTPRHEDILGDAFPRSALGGVKWSASSSGRFTPETDPGIRWIGGWVHTRAGVDAVVKKIIPASAGNRTLIVQPLALSLY